MTLHVFFPPSLLERWVQSSGSDSTSYLHAPSLAELDPFLCRFSKTSPFYEEVIPQSFYQISSEALKSSRELFQTRASALLGALDATEDVFEGAPIYLAPLLST